MKALVLIVVLFIFYGSSCTNGTETVILHEIELPETREFKNFWKEFSVKFNSLDTAAVKKTFLDTVWLWGARVSSADFINRHFDNYLNTDISEIILDTTKTSYSSIGCHPSPPVEEAIQQEYGNAFDCQEVNIRDTIGSVVNSIEFTFLRTTKGYKLFGLKRYNYSWSRIEQRIDTTSPED